jgi:hypothetical protein
VNNKLSIGEVVTLQENVFTFDPSKYSVPKKIEEGPAITIGKNILNLTHRPCSKTRGQTNQINLQQI